MMVDIKIIFLLRCKTNSPRIYFFVQNDEPVLKYAEAEIRKSISEE